VKDSDQTILRMDNIHASYGSVQCESVVLIGHHGCGKTAVLKAICGLLPISSGKILFNKSPIHKLTAEMIVTFGISYVDETKLLFPAMNVNDNLILGAYCRWGKDKRNIIKQDIELVYRLFPILKERKGQYAGTLSGGEQQMLAIGRALMSDPKLLLLDCPTLGLAPRLVKKVVKAVSELKERQVTIFLVDQNLHQVINIIDRGYVMKEGRITKEAYPKELLAMEESGRSYFNNQR
jgi:branched-chain amino acid transport system ATP-binding protein